VAAPAEREGGGEDDDDDRSGEERPPRRSPRQHDEDRVAGQQDEHAAPIGAELAAANGDEREGRDCRDGPAADDRGARERRDEQQRRQQVREAVEARVLRRPEGRKRDPARVDRHRDQIRDEHPREQEAVGDERQSRECDSRRCEQHDHGHVDPHIRPTCGPERDVRQQDARESREDGPAPEDREHDDQRQRDDQYGGLRIAVLVDAAVEREQRGGRIVRACRAELRAVPERGRGDVHDGDEPWNPRRVRRQQPPVTGGNDDDRVTAVVRLRAALRDPNHDAR